MGETVFRIIVSLIGALVWYVLDIRLNIKIGKTIEFHLGRKED